MLTHNPFPDDGGISEDKMQHRVIPVDTLLSADEFRSLMYYMRRQRMGQAEAVRTLILIGLGRREREEAPVQWVAPTVVTGPAEDNDRFLMSDIIGSGRLTSALFGAGVMTVDELLIRLAKDTLQEINGIGPSTEALILATLEELGIVTAVEHE